MEVYSVLVVDCDRIDTFAMIIIVANTYLYFAAPLDPLKLQLRSLNSPQQILNDVSDSQCVKQVGHCRQIKVDGPSPNCGPTVPAT